MQSCPHVCLVLLKISIVSEKNNEEQTMYIVIYIYIYLA